MAASQLVFLRGGHHNKQLKQLKQPRQQRQLNRQSKMSQSHSVFLRGGHHNKPLKQPRQHGTPTKSLIKNENNENNTNKIHVTCTTSSLFQCFQVVRCGRTIQELKIPPSSYHVLHKTFGFGHFKSLFCREQ